MVWKSITLALIFCSTRRTASIPRPTTVSVSYMKAFHTSTEQLAGVLKKVNPKVTVLYHYVTFTPWNATDQERGVKEIKQFGYNGVVIQSQDADIF
jgi:ribonuclease BN (tRNA processing enzyme)